jgi:hypothetical protein
VTSVENSTKEIIAETENVGKSANTVVTEATQMAERAEKCLVVFKNDWRSQEIAR